MCKKVMVEFKPDEMMKRVNAKVHGKKAVCFTRIANTTKKDVSTVRRWFRDGRMPAVDFYMLNDWIGTSEPKQMDFNELDFRDLIKDKEAVEIKKFAASPLRLTPPVEKRFRSLCDFLDHDASEMLDRIVTNYMNVAKGRFRGEMYSRPYTIEAREAKGPTVKDDEE